MKKLHVSIVSLISFWCCVSQAYGEGVSNETTGNTDIPPVVSGNDSSEVSMPNLILSASLVKGGDPIRSGLVWRIYSVNKGRTLLGPDQVNNDKLVNSLRTNMKRIIKVKESSDALSNFTLPPGDYYVECSFGRISSIKSVRIERNSIINTTINLDAGAVQIGAEVVNGSVDTNKLRFSVYADDSESKDYSLILQDIHEGDIVPLKKGYYHLVSNYGSVNAVKRANINVQSGKISRVTFKHEAAKVTLRLLRDKDGEALADTKWSIRDASGDIVYSTTGAYAVAILTSGNYTALAENKSELYQKDFSIESGHDIDLDVLTSDKSNFKENKSDAWATD